MQNGECGRRKGSSPTGEGTSTGRRQSLGYCLGLLVALLSLVGCSTAPTAGPVSAVSYQTRAWDAKYPSSKCIQTEHYCIYTDLRDEQVDDQLAQVMEGAYGQYVAVSPPRVVNQQPMRCFIFSRRDEWVAFTKKNAGVDAAVYLQINRGAYAVDDWFVAFWLGDQGTFSVASHEGWHQYVARNFAARMPPTLEEGIACGFENIRWNGRLPAWDLEHSPSRSGALKDAMAAGQMWTMAQLLRLHAGDVISLPKARIEAFYAQSWAMALFLLRDTGRYREAMDRYMADLAAGSVYRPAEFSRLKLNEWNPALSQPQLEHYLGVPVAKIESEYREYCKQLAGRAGEE